MHNYCVKLLNLSHILSVKFTQFEIIWTTDRGGDGMLEELKLPHTRYDAPVVNGKGLYKRIFIRKRLSSAN